MSLTARFGAALAFADELHRLQRRKGNDTPYIAHLLAVASLALEAGATEDEAIAALLHDAIEDQGGSDTRDEIARRFGPDVAEIVEQCSEWPGSGSKPAWRTRKQDYIDCLASSSPSALLVSGADKLHNARSLLSDYRKQGEALWSRFNGGREGTLWYYRAVASALGDAGAPEALVAEIGRVVGELETLAAAFEEQRRS